MPLPLINSIASWILKQRIHQIELFMKYPMEVQEEILFGLLKSAENTVLGKKYDYQSIKNYQTFNERIPVSTYEELEPYIEQTRQGAQNIFWNSSVKYFAKSSGTTNAKSKFIEHYLMLITSTICTFNHSFTLSAFFSCSRTLNTFGFVFGFVFGA